MKVKTTVNVNGQNLYNEVAVCEMKAIEPLQDGGLRFSAEYQKEDGTVVKSVPKTYTEEQVTALYNSFASSVTKKQPVLFIWECMGKAMIKEVALTFGIQESEVVIVTE
jgi:hypothetical protein